EVDDRLSGADLEPARERDVRSEKMCAARERDLELAARVAELDVGLVDVEAARRELADVELRVECERREADVRGDRDVHARNRAVEVDRETGVVVELADGAAVRRHLDLEFLRGHRAG